VSGPPQNKQFLLEEMGGGVALFDYDNVHTRAFSDPFGYPCAFYQVLCFPDPAYGILPAFGGSLLFALFTVQGG